MRTSWIFIGVCLLASVPSIWLATPRHVESADSLPSAIADAPLSLAAASSTPVQVVEHPHASPARLSIPAIGLDVPIEALGLNEKGEMDVPKATSGKVGWYKYGTVPGDTGSAVIDAHVFAAFSNLHNLPVNGDAYVTTENGEVLHFIVREATTYPLAKVPAERIFNRADGRYLNLITCAGTFIARDATYDHRLVVYAELID